MDFTEEQRKAARRMVRDYESWCDMRWEDEMFALSLKLRLSDEEVQELIETYGY